MCSILVSCSWALVISVTCVQSSMLWSEHFIYHCISNLNEFSKRCAAEVLVFLAIRKMLFTFTFQHGPTDKRLSLSLPGLEQSKGAFHFHIQAEPIESRLSISHPGWTNRKSPFTFTSRPEPVERHLSESGLALCDQKAPSSFIHLKLHDEPVERPLLFSVTAWSWSPQERV